MSDSTVLVVEDDNSLREALCDTLEMAGFSVNSVADGQAALQAMEKEPVNMVVSDVHMKPMNGHNLLLQLRTKYPNLPVVLMSAYGNVENAVSAMREGASDYLVKPFDGDVLINMVERYLSQQDVNPDLVAEDARSTEQVALAERVAASDATVMISGESGTGKEVFARHIHRCSRRADKPFIAINCAAIPENMLEAVLFGYEKGAFTGAYSASAGKFEQAQGGTLLLDEVSEMDLGLQAKLLRVLQEREVERLGGKKIIPLDVRVLATTNRNLRQQVVAGKFREDLFYRLNVFPMSLLALRARPNDIMPLASTFVKRHIDIGELPPQFDDGAQARLCGYHWPGNVRELDNVIQRALILRHGSVIRAADILFEQEAEEAGMARQNITPVAVVPIESMDPHQPLVEESKLASNVQDLSGDLKAREFQLILDALHECGSRKATAEKLGVSPRTLRYKLARMREAGMVIPGENSDIG